MATGYSSHLKNPFFLFHPEVSVYRFDFVRWLIHSCWTQFYFSFSYFLNCYIGSISKMYIHLNHHYSFGLFSRRPGWNELYKCIKIYKIKIVYLATNLPNWVKIHTSRLSRMMASFISVLSTSSGRRCCYQWVFLSKGLFVAGIYLQGRCSMCRINMMTFFVAVQLEVEEDRRGEKWASGLLFSLAELQLACL